MTKRGAAQAFLEAAIASDTDECIIWPFATINGYGRVVVSGKGQSTLSRVVLERTGRPAPTVDHHLGAMALHSCDNRACCNPRHLRWGDHTENQADRRRRYRDRTRGRAALTPTGLVAEDIRFIRRRAQLGEPLDLIARDFEVSTQVIRSIVKRKTWADVA